VRQSIYEARMEEALRLFYNQGVRQVAFGDIFSKTSAPTAKKSSPASHDRPLPDLAARHARTNHFFICNAFRAIAACIDSKVLDPSFAGRELDEILLPRSSAPRRPVR